MQIFEGLSKLNYDKNTVITLGSFDGIHLGHKKIINKLLECSENSDCRNILVTFEPHPRLVLSTDFKLQLLTTMEEKMFLLDKLGVQNLLIIPFTKEFSNLSSEEFVKNYFVDKIGLTELVIGYDHHFGKNRDGDKNTLVNLGKKYNFRVSSVDAVKINDQAVSSTRIRKSLLNGDIKTATDQLGRYYSFGGVVVQGDKRGRQLGYPTANIKPDNKFKLLPAIGIYAVRILVHGNWFKGVMSIGKRPTFYTDGDLITEVFIFDFDQEIYNQTVSVEIVQRIRGEEKFSNINDLVNQIKKDVEDSKEILNNLIN